jgi:tight adherence protein C
MMTVVEALAIGCWGVAAVLGGRGLVVGLQAPKRQRRWERMRAIKSPAKTPKILSRWRTTARGLVLGIGAHYRRQPEPGWALLVDAVFGPGRREWWWGTLVMQAVILAVAVFSGFMAWHVSWVVSGLAALGAAFWVRMWKPIHLRTLWDRKRQTIRAGLADIFDLLSVSVAAGLSLDAALGYVVPAIAQPLRQMFEELRRDIQWGATRREAFQRMAERTQLDEVRRLAQLVSQSEQLGTGLSAALRAEAQRLRAIRVTQARERAGRLPVLMTFPIVLLLLPALYVLLVGPAVLMVLRSLKGGL